MRKTKRALALIILDGFGINWKKEGNAIAQAKTPNLDFFCDYFPKTTVNHSGLSVGLPKDIVGNSEVGHKSIGSGRISLQTMYAIKRALDYGQFFDNPAFKESIENAKRNNSKLHIIGLLSDAGGHSHIDHLFGIFRCLLNAGLKERIFVHAITDGRDVPPKSAERYIKLLQNTVINSGLDAKIASIGGRYWGMDRGENWDRVEKHYKAMIGISDNKVGEGNIYKYIEKSYKEGIFDEFIEPATVVDENGGAIAKIEPGDSVMFFNFRPDRMKELLSCFYDKEFTKFDRKKIDGIYSTFIKNIQITSLTEYEIGMKERNVSVAFDEPKLDNTLSEFLSKKGFSQLHIAEKEKEAHITYFLNGGNKSPFPGEDWKIIPSPKVKTYDLMPQMATPEIADELVKNIEAGNYDFYAVNFASPDMVGHTGDLEAGVKAVEALDAELGKVYKAIERTGDFMIMVSDHGNIEEMINPETGERDTEHNIYPAPFLLVSPEIKKNIPSDIKIEELANSPTGTLADIMPTILDLYGLEMPEIELYGESKGSSLLGRLK